MTSETLHVAIIGAGATGLLIAQGLKKANIRVSVFEGMSQDTYDNNPRTWTMALHWSRRNVEQCLPAHLFRDLFLAYTNPWQEPSQEQAQSLPISDGKTGELLFAAPVDDARRVVRQKLRNLFRQELNVNFGHELLEVKIHQGEVVLAFQHGESITADIVIGADGAKSVVRNHLVEGEARTLKRVPLVSTNIGCRYSAEQAMYLRKRIHPIANMSVHPDQETLFFLALADVPDPKDPKTWEFQVALSLWTDEEPPETNEGRMKLFKKLAGSYCEPYRSAALWVPDDTYIPRDKYAEWTSIVPWNNFGGRITLAGDAAHPMCPFRGQGLNNALQDAGNLVNALVAVQQGAKSMAAAIDSYDAEVYARGKREIETSEESMYGLHHYDAVKSSPLNNIGLREQKN
ncbi:hypothetical protein CkaCkLH20_11544 [Colletotrichum karsti]|uniref:FAD-binding domain-containing protein n=1 Tax=Colletotrichum karsti TaxID=1095194 RepID=A0A9P6LFY9_9PEZI|nr:uncharacterized protein CkaCkLH20_11544 [Colletotrichum karsti]KAF9870872.1 hypothetical protein CkaCkLH20_11544 [Colletotrichum karsti]